jgi:hypothetical protein
MPFTPEEFLDVFRRYNDEVWPMQWILATVAIGAVILALRGSARNGRIVSGILAGLWLWMAVAYHFAYFATISRTAYVFGALFAGEALLLLLVGVKQNQLGFRVRASVTGVAGACLVMYALLIYPILSHALGHRYPASPTFGLPCATTIFTFGLLLWSDQKVPWRLIVIPAAWSLVGFSAAVSLGMIEDYGLVLAAALGTALVLATNHRRRQPVLAGSA